MNIDYRFVCLCSMILSLSLNGCSRLPGVFASVPDKVNLAFPVATDVRAAEINLRERLASDEDALDTFEPLYARRLELRALNCTQDQNIGRFDTIADVKSLHINQECLAKQDKELLEFLGIRLVLTRLALPPLRPLIPLGPAAAVHPDIDDINANSATAASNAGVAVLKGQDGKLMSLSLPSFEKIARLPSAQLSYESIRISPNGRLAAVPVYNTGISFIDTETGAQLWEAKNFTRLLAWIPSVNVALVNNGSSGSVSLIDFEGSRFEPQTTSGRGYSWAVAIGHDSSRVILGAQNNFSLIEYNRTPSGIERHTLKTYDIKESSGASAYQPMLMKNGKALIFVSRQNLVMVDLDSGEETVWAMEGFLNRQFVKLNETEVLLNNTHTTRNSRAWVFDIEESSLAPVLSWSEPIGVIGGLSGRAGYFLRRGGLLIGDEVNVGPAISLDEANIAYQLERQEAILLATARASNVNSLQYRLLRDDLANPGTITPAPAAPPTPSNYSSMRTPSMVAKLVQNARIEAIGVYQGTGNRYIPGVREKQAGTVIVRVRPSATPVVLLLSSYEAVRWQILPSPGAKIQAILLSGLHQSSVAGSGQARVFSFGTTYAYQMDSPAYAALNLATLRYTGKKIDIFQGQYEGASFEVGG